MANQINLRESVNTISAVVNNRPRPLREFDQIFMKTADMLLQADHVSRYLDDKRLVCIGDGDAIGLCLIHLKNQGIFSQGPKSLHVLDFDERVVFSVRRFAEMYNVTDKVTAELYNVADSLPQQHWGNFDGFYTNPPFGASNKGISVKAFVERGIEAVVNGGIGCLVVADDQEHDWSQAVLRAAQKMVINKGFVIAEIIPAFHTYHLDDSPDLTSCSMIIRRFKEKESEYNSQPLSPEKLSDFYGEGKSLKVKYVRDLTKGNAVTSQDYKFEEINGENL
jgi:predicted methyltransferase